MSTAWKPTRPWLQFSLRTFLVAVMTIAICFGLLVSRAHRERQIIAAIEDRGGWAEAAAAELMAAYPKYKVCLSDCTMCITAGQCRPDASQTVRVK